jgi:DNA ligase-1
MSTKIPTFKKLTKETNGKIYEWIIKINKINDEHYEIITLNGYSDGKKAEHKVDIKKGKAGRSVLEQAILETQSKFNKKEKEYSTEIFKPMLADKVKPELYDPKSKSKAFKIEFPAYVQPKLDGLRCISYLENGQVILQSRTGMRFENFDLLRSQLMILFDILGENVYLDGELYTESIIFEELSGLVRLTSEKTSELQMEKINSIKYNLFDIYFLNSPNMIYEERKEKVEQLMKINKIFLIQLVDSRLIHNFDEVDSLHNDFVSNGYEGIMLRDKNGIYEPNKRSKYLQKYKKFMEEEFKIIDFKEGNGDEKGCVIWRCINKDGKEFSVRPKGTREQRKEYFKNGSKYVGKKLTVIFQEYEDSGIPRFPVGKDVREGY